MDLVEHTDPRPGQSGDVSASAPQRCRARGVGTGELAQAWPRP